MYTVYIIEYQQEERDYTRNKEYLFWFTGTYYY